MKAASQVPASSDEDLVRLAQADPEGPQGRTAASELFRRYQDRVYLWCFRRLGHHERACDLAQEVFLAAYRALPSFEGRSRFSSWLFSIARFRAISQIRTPRILLDADADPEARADPAKDPAERYIAQREEEEMLALLEEVLEPDERLALWMRCYEGLSVDEISRRLDVAGSTGARALLQRARRKLRVGLAARGIGEPEP
jgi:RNA polymerase sigma-70 factor (ECF subfamily)